MEQNQQNKHLVPLAIVVAGGLIAGAIYFGGKPNNTRSVVTDILNETQVDVPPVTEKDHILGSRSTPVVIIEYSDTECPFCKTFHKTMKDVVAAYGGQVAWVYRHFPIAQLHAKAGKEAEATECASELGGNQGFWNYIDRVFQTTRSNDSLDPNELPKIATAIGLDEATFNECLSSGKYAEFIKTSVTEAIKAGARGTPYSVIVTQDGRKVVINGAELLQSVKAKIDLLLK